MKRLLWCAILVSVAASACAAQIKVPESWDKLAAKADQVTNVTLDKNMLGFASKFMNDKDDKEARRLIEGLNAIYVHSLEFKSEGAYTDADVAPIREQLRGPEWSRIVDTFNQADREKVEIYVRTVNDQSAGLVILAQEPTELTFVNLDGPISPEQLGELAGNFGIPPHLPPPPPRQARVSPSASAQNNENRVQRVRVGEGVIKGNLIDSVPAQCTAMAQQARISGNVLIAAMIGPNGSVENLRVLSGHPLLIQSAMEAARQWRFKPWTLNGQPVEVETTITVPFNCG